MIQLIQNKAMILNPENIEEVVKNPEAYRGYTFTLVGESVRKRRGIPKFYGLVSELFSVWAIYNWEFKIIAPEGIESIGWPVREFVNEVV